MTQEYQLGRSTDTSPPSVTAANTSLGLIPYGLLFIWYIMLITPLPAAGVIRYAVDAILLIFIFPVRREMLQVARDMGFIFLLPGLITLSLLWTPEKADGAMFVLVLWLGLMVMLFGATRATFNQIVLVFLVGLAIAALMSVLAPNTKSLYGGAQSADLGVFSQKNYLGKRMMVLCIVSFYVLINRDFQWWWRVVSLGTLGLGFLLVVRSDSATALLLTTGAIALLVLLSMGWKVLERVKGAIALAIVAAVFMAALGGFLMSLNSVNPIEAGLAMIGKDSTLTGRTVLWEHARVYIADHPWLGAGVQGFWRPQHSEAVQIATVFRHEPGAFRFSFHNSFFELGVHYGIAGMVLLAITLLSALFVIVRDFLKFRDSQGALAVVVAAVVTSRSFTEAEWATAAEINVLLLFTFAGIALRRWREYKGQPAPDRA